MGEPLPVSVDTAHNDQGESAGWLSSILAQVLIQETVSNVNDRFKLAADAIDQEIEVHLLLFPVRLACSERCRGRGDILEMKTQTSAVVSRHCWRRKKLSTKQLKRNNSK